MVERGVQIIAFCVSISGFSGACVSYFVRFIFAA